jgi:alpha-glucosidase
MRININDANITYSVQHKTDTMLAESPISMTLGDGARPGVNPRLTSQTRDTINEQIDTTAYKRKTITNHCNQLTLAFAGDYQILFRAYDDGVAYRFIYNTGKPFTVQSEQAAFNFPTDAPVVASYVRGATKNTYEKQTFSSFSNLYKHHTLSQWDKTRLVMLPLLVSGPNGKRICITEADLLEYPGMFIIPGPAPHTLQGYHAAYPKETEQGGHNQLQSLVKSRENYIARYDRGTQFPWRVIIISETDAQLCDSDMVYKLATPSRLADTTWIKPGKVAWDWWCDWNLHGVDYETGVNNATYKTFIDFASKNGIEYVILDEGWAVNLQADLFQVVPEIDLRELIAYAAAKHVGLILWGGYLAFDKDMDRICKHYSEMGIKGFKIDFMDRDDQPIVDFHRRAAETSAKYKLLMDYHGTYKPTGLQRTYPNVVNFEGVYGLEQLKWAGKDTDMVTHDVTLPFVRMVAGPLDYTQGAMRNATKTNFYPCYNEPMSQGTRCRQLAEYIIFESPLNMLCDSPTNYETEPESIRFIAEIPTTWDDTKALAGEVAKHITLARRKGDTWYIGGMTNWDAREMPIDLTFLGEGHYKIELFRDGPNAAKTARDYVHEYINLPAARKLTIKTAPGGGFALRITKY